MKDFTLRPHKLEDPIVLVGIEGINRLKEKTGRGGHVTGGMAASSYLPEEEHRYTIDLDYCLLWGGGTGEYRELISPLREHLRESGYSIRYKKSGFTHDLVVEDNDDSLLIQHQRRSKGNFEKNRRGLEREVANHRIISKEDLTYAVLSPEDIILHKLSRAMLFADKYGVALPRDMPLKDFKTSIDAIRANVLARGDNVDPQEVARLRVFYDLYDIRCIANNVGLNANYFDESLVDWLKNDFKGLDFRKTLDRLGIALS